MIFEFKLPMIRSHMEEAIVEYLHAAPGSRLKAGEKLIDLSVDLSRNFSLDCPPISFFRIVMREPLVLREFRAVAGQVCKVGEVIAIFEDETGGSQPASREIRFATAGIIHHEKMWTGNER